MQGRLSDRLDSHRHRWSGMYSSSLWPWRRMIGRKCRKELKFWITRNSISFTFHCGGMTRCLHWYTYYLREFQCGMSDDHRFELFQLHDYVHLRCGYVGVELRAMNWCESFLDRYGQKREKIQFIEWIFEIATPTYRIGIIPNVIFFELMSYVHLTL